MRHVRVLMAWLLLSAVIGCGGGEDEGADTGGDPAPAQNRTADEPTQRAQPEGKELRREIQSLNRETREARRERQALESELERLSSALEASESEAARLEEQVRRLEAKQ